MRNVREKKKPKDPFYEYDKTDQYRTALFPNEEMRLMYPIEGVLDIVPDSYFITSYGRVFTTIKNKGLRLYEVHSHLLPDGYYVIDLMGINKERLNLRINRLVALFFVKFKFEKQYDYPILEADHIDGEKTNNHWSNLRWLDHDTNIEQMNLRLCMSKEEWLNYIRINNIRGEYRDLNSYYRGLQESSIYIEKQINIAREIYRLTETTNMTNLQISCKYYCLPEKIERIRNLSAPFDRLLYFEFKCKKPKSVPYEDEVILLAYQMCKDEIIGEEIMKKCGISKTALPDIKFCRGSYEYLRYRYGLEPLDSCFGLREKLALSVYYDLSKKAKTIDLMKKYGLSDTVITDIKFCRGAFRFLNERFHLEPLPRTGRS